jgi:hypothetical protein
MALQKSSSTPADVTRRDLLRVGAAALGVAVLPRAAGAATHRGGDALESLKADYRKRIEALTNELESRFRSGEFRGNSDAEQPLHRLENELRKRIAKTYAEAHLVLACSSSTIATSDVACEDPRYHAGDAAARDVVREALKRGAYRPDAGRDEYPTAEDLLVTDFALAEEPLEENAS